jgi:cell wall-associated NlpC family hydrolase
MKKLVFLILSFFIISNLYSQNRALNKVSLLYNQGNYRLTFWRADELLNNPDYDTSNIPLYYKSLSLFHLQGKFLFRNREKDPWVEASKDFIKLKNQPNSKRFIQIHKEEISALRDYLLDELTWLKTKNDLKKAELLSKSISGLFDGLKLNPIKSKFKNETILSPKTIVKSNNSLKFEREQILSNAEKYIGTPYVFGGDSLDGFDCSGFTGYVYNNINMNVGRTSRDQFQSCKKINREDVQPGDLIFFNSGKEEVTNVGIIVSTQGEPLKMIPSSSSKGVVVSEVETSEYWMKKLTGFGTFFD